LNLRAFSDILARDESACATAWRAPCKECPMPAVMLKISGEALMGDQGYRPASPTVQRIAQEVKSVHDLGVEICMVIGGGNIFRGLQGSARRGWNAPPPIIWGCWRP
jgi:hypothetical protein